jgi:hypothetical protein
MVGKFSGISDHALDITIADVQGDCAGKLGRLFCLHFCACFVVGLPCKAFGFKLRNLWKKYYAFT